MEEEKRRFLEMLRIRERSLAPAVSTAVEDPAARLRRPSMTPGESAVMLRMLRAGGGGVDVTTTNRSRGNGALYRDGEISLMGDRFSVGEGIRKELFNGPKGNTGFVLGHEFGHHLQENVPDIGRDAPPGGLMALIRSSTDKEGVRRRMTQIDADVTGYVFAEAAGQDVSIADSSTTVTRDIKGADQRFFDSYANGGALRDDIRLARMRTETMSLLDMIAARRRQIDSLSVRKQF